MGYPNFDRDSIDLDDTQKKIKKKDRNESKGLSARLCVSHALHPKFSGKPVSQRV